MLQQNFPHGETLSKKFAREPSKGWRRGYVCSEKMLEVKSNGTPLAIGHLSVFLPFFFSMELAPIIAREPLELRQLSCMTPRIFSEYTHRYLQRLWEFPYKCSNHGFLVGKNSFLDICWSVFILRRLFVHFSHS